ncbi:hypothetical protein NQ314_019464 [Rhamnusium bicolor]|uniref:Uncharacterized protein n=1 Tax=Rhamnusium bicolor TaxID=1586634 RepID=A0AAV8WN96_9CUCU|nr:hypothetical protein NQ314_019464 [Rhamnusium bicolor]
MDDSDLKKNNGGDMSYVTADMGPQTSLDLMSDENASSDLEVPPVGQKKSDNNTNEGAEEIRRIRWKEQKKLITDHFKAHIKKKMAPRKHEVEVFINQHKHIFKEKNLIKVKAFVYSSYK